MVVRGSVSHYGTSVPGPSKAAAKATESWQGAECTLIGSSKKPELWAFQYLFYWKTLQFSSKILLNKRNVLIFGGNVTDLPSQN